MNGRGSEKIVRSTVCELDCGHLDKVESQLGNDPQLSAEWSWGNRSSLVAGHHALQADRDHNLCLLCSKAFSSSSTSLDCLDYLYLYSDHDRTDYLGNPVHSPQDYLGTLLYLHHDHDAALGVDLATAPTRVFDHAHGQLRDLSVSDLFAEAVRTHVRLDHQQKSIMGERSLVVRLTDLKLGPRPG